MYKQETIKLVNGNWQFNVYTSSGTLVYSVTRFSERAISQEQLRFLTKGPQESPRKRSIVSCGV